MDYYLKQATMLKKLASKSNSQINYNQPSISQPQTGNNYLSIAQDNNKVDYYNEAINLLSNYIQDSTKLSNVVDTLNNDNENYLKDLVLNWNIYEQELQSLKGSVVSVKRVVDLLEDRLDVNLGKKKETQIVTANNDVADFFFNEKTQSMNTFQDSKATVKSILTSLLGLDKNSSDKTIFKELNNNNSKNMSKDIVDSLVEYSKVLKDVDKTKAISDIVNTIELFINSNKIPSVLISDIINESNKHIHQAFQEHLSISKKFLLSNDLSQFLSQCNLYFIFIFDNYTTKIINDTNTNISSNNDIVLLNASNDLTNELINKIISVKDANNPNRFIEICKILNLLTPDSEEFLVSKKGENKLPKDVKKRLFDDRNKLKETLMKGIIEVLINYNNSSDNIISYAFSNNSDSHKADTQLLNILLVLPNAKTLEKNISSTIARGQSNILSSSTANAPVKSGNGLKPNEKAIRDKYFVNTDLLKNHGILEIRYIKNRHLAHLKPPTLSENCKHCITAMIDGGKINTDHFVSLSQFEKDMLRRIDKLFQTNQDLDDDSENNFVKSFELLKGSYLAGNNSQSVKDALRQYIYHAEDIGKINKYTANKMLFELKLL